MSKKTNGAPTSGAAVSAQEEFRPKHVAEEVVDELDRIAEDIGGPYRPPPEADGAVGFTHFDAPNSEDDHVVVLLTMENIEQLPMQSLVRIKSLADPKRKLPARKYLGVVTAGPFAEPDGLKVDSSIVVATTTEGKGRVLLPRYHGRAFVQIMGEEIDVADKVQTVPHRYRPRPNSPVFPLTTGETADVLHVGGDACLGLMIGRDDIEVGIRTDSKAALPRHTGIVGTTGGGKSTTVARLIQQLQKAGAAVVLFDVEGEYTEIDQPTEDPTMLAALARRKQKPEGVKNLRVHHLVGRETSRQTTPAVASPFRLDFADLSPYAVMEILDISEAQQERFLKTYDTLRMLMRDLGIFPRKGDQQEQQRALELDELETGYPRMTLRMIIDVANVFHDWAANSGDKDGSDHATPTYPIIAPELKGKESQIRQYVARANAQKDVRSWRGLLGKLLRIARLNVFDNRSAEPLDPVMLTQGGHVSVVDLSDTDAPAVNNLVIATLLRQIQAQQEDNFHDAEAEGHRPTPTVVIIEEAHEFLSAGRIKQMQTLFAQVARIAKRGRKRWLGLVFVTQLPQHLPDEVIGLVNSWVIHKIADSGVIDRLRKSIAGLDKGQWSSVPSLTAGQAVVSLTTGARPVLTAIDPTPCRLRMAE